MGGRKNIDSFLPKHWTGYIRYDAAVQEWEGMCCFKGAEIDGIWRTFSADRESAIRIIREKIAAYVMRSYKMPAIDRLRALTHDDRNLNKEERKLCLKLVIELTIQNNEEE